jgi:hypothetical protein
MSHTHRDFSNFVPRSLIGGIQCTNCGKKRDIISMFAWRSIHSVPISTMVTIKELPNEEGYPFRVINVVIKEKIWRWLHSEAMSHCSEMDPLQSLNLERIDNLLDVRQDPGNWITTNSLHLFPSPMRNSAACYNSVLLHTLRLDPAWGLLALIKCRFHVPTCHVNVWNNHIFTLSTNVVPWF